MKHESAFPSVAKYCIGHDANNAPIYDEQNFPGMTLCDYFAAKAMSAQVVAVGGIEHNNRTQCAEIATFSYTMADAMIAARGAK